MNIMKIVLGLTAATLLAIPSAASASAPEACGGDKVLTKASGDIVDTAASTGSFKTLLAAATAAGLVDTLKSEGPFTVFAPTDAAFAKLPKGTVEALLKDTEKLKSILLYHVVSGKVMASQAMKLSKATSVQGSDIKLKVVGGKLMVDSATVTAADVKASNGVIHVIDSVIMPTGPKSAMR